MKNALFLLLLGLVVFSCQSKKNTKELKTESYTIGNMKITEFINNQNGNIVEAIIVDGKDTFIARPIRPIGQRPNRIGLTHQIIIIALSNVLYVAVCAKKTVKEFQIIKYINV